MAARRGRRRSGHRPLGGVSGPEQTVERDGRTYATRMIPGQSATRRYACPWCCDAIPAGEPHVVVWPADEAAGLAQRRHWHTRCWRRAGG